ncbi:non-ribosomal peptide synthetase [Denitromonas iodatirespirans]|uniref:Amino acid adenylation domain-containing protein n=1 Tax=Denitromonas iodatirespirans TaxID=2795389 RepID=A0A944DDC9_DENI1|nr:amino acid adenylation domain-containing protein [Denitromonas iodatirespirans]MBT0964145.1 amino acid adenylation domain-containing protein [Denitromonas iodatirespirans]
MFINTLPVRLRIDERGVEAALRQTHETLARLLHHEHAPLALAQRCSGVDAQAPLFTSLFNYRHSGLPSAGQPSSDGADEAYEDSFEAVSSLERTNYPLAISVDDFGEAYLLTTHASVGVDVDLVGQMMVEAVRGLVESLEGERSSELCTIEVLPEGVRKQVIEGLNATRNDYLSTKCVHELFEAQAMRAGQAPALAHGNETLTYQEVNVRANRLAHHLIQLGVTPDSRVAICVHRGPDLVIGLLAILKAGGAYVPLDPTYPSDRVAYMLEDSRPVVVLTHAGVGAAVEASLSIGVARYSQSVPVIDLCSSKGGWADCSDRNPRVEGLTVKHLAYVIYTSGSTGRPKGVMVEHQGFTNLAFAQKAAFGIKSSSRVLQFASPSFDASASEIGVTLAAGACLCVAPAEKLMPGEPLLELMQYHSITHVTLPPSALKPCRETALPFAPSTLIVAGEAVSPDDARVWSEEVEMINAYGPTETTVCATTFKLDAPWHGAVPIGRPIANMRVYILNARLQPVPKGVPGEIFVSGDGVARGYLNQPEMTAERFLADPFVAGARMYRTGDLGRWSADGNVEYLGRNDFQVKIRGFRIELGEVEAKLIQHEQVEEAAVLALDYGGDKRLVAYVTGPETLTSEVLRTHAQQMLPHFMVPGAYVRMDRLPLTLNGKLDRKALPMPDSLAYVQREYVAPDGEIETHLASIWSDLLHVTRVGRQDNFFELGGHSLLAVQLVSRVQKVFDVSVPLYELHIAPTLQEMADRIALEQRSGDVDGCLVKIRAEGSEPPLFFVHALGGNVDYAVTLSEWIDASVPVYGLTATGLQPGEVPLRDVPAMAGRYIATMRQVQRSGPYRIIGWSAGGMVAYEMARQLRASGQEVAFVGLIDTLFRSNAIVDEMQMWLPDDETARELAQRERAFLLVMLQHDLGLSKWRVKSLAKLDTVEGIVAKLAGTDDDDEEERQFYQRLNAMQYAFVEAIEVYEPEALESYRGVHLFAASASQRNSPTLGWDILAGDNINVISVQGDHESIVRPPRGPRLGQLISKVLISKQTEQASIQESV